MDAVYSGATTRGIVPRLSTKHAISGVEMDGAVQSVRQDAVYGIQVVVVSTRVVSTRTL